MSNSALDIEETRIPGLNRPIYWEMGEMFPSALHDNDIEDCIITLRMLTLREKSMLQFINSITDKQDWHIKVNDDKISDKWKSEVLSSGADFTSEMADYCIAELRHLSKDPANVSEVFVFNGDVVKSDTAVSSELRDALQTTIGEFEAAIPEKKRDWHPGSNGQVLDLVHPSLFPLVYGSSKVLTSGKQLTLDDCIRRAGEGEVRNVEEEVQSPFSAKFQWLPCEVDISAETAKITTYINNLHPEKTKPLYGLIEKLIDASIPLWNKTLAPLIEEEYSRFYHHRRISVDSVYDPYEEDETQYIRPLPEEFDASSYLKPKPYDLRKEYKDKGLQVIVKIASIHLTPEKPKYEGGTWHVEGQSNEHIAATSLFYYSSENITTSTLSFRHIVDPQEAFEISCPQDDHAWLRDLFGFPSQRSTVQDTGSVVTREGRLLTFPNILQHRVDPFELVDKTKPGHRKIVALFLVDPHMKIISTAHVPCQQQEWWWEFAMSDEKNKAKEGLKATPSPAPALGRKSAIDEVPLELQDNILTNVDFPFSVSQAKTWREELMKERKAFVVDQGKQFERLEFSLCEH